ncbi:hypothetical protein Pelo_14885 [Pelomyxa schiedti]|nr:hypothetical protein Pelo_14885 [Pelomyxa schiedti]
MTSTDWIKIRPTNQQISEINQMARTRIANSLVSKSLTAKSTSQSHQGHQSALLQASKTPQTATTASGKSTALPLGAPVSAQHIGGARSSTLHPPAVPHPSTRETLEILEGNIATEIANAKREEATLQQYNVQVGAMIGIINIINSGLRQRQDHPPSHS